MELKGNTIVITGGSSGIGLELAKILSEKDNTVLVCGRSEEKLALAHEAIPSLRAFQCDLSQADERDRFADWIENEYPQCNILINNAAMVHKTNFFTDTDMVKKAEIEVQTNFMAPVALTKRLIPVLESNANAHLIYITTGLVYAPKAAYPVYCATKSALHSFIRTLRMQASHLSTSIHEVLMPAVDTPFHKGDTPTIAISAPTAVAEMIERLEKGQLEIKVGAVKILKPLSRLAPNFAMKKVNSV